MSQTFTCRGGHRWELSDAAAVQAEDGEILCPVCTETSVELPPPSDPVPGVARLQELLAPTPAEPGAASTGENTQDKHAGTTATVRELPRVPGYEILGELGRGGMGVVYKARRGALKRFVALKMILLGPYADARQRERFRREAEAAARLQHANIVQVYEVGEHQGQPYLALEYVQGASLDQLLAGTPSAAPAAAELVRTLAEAMHYAHQRGVVHRDLKPANVLLEGVERRELRVESQNESSGTPSLNSQLSTLIPKITDFGLAKQLDGQSAHTQTGAILGTPSYMAPEQAGGVGEAIGPAVDVYALGAILYEMLTGRPPFHAASPMETLDQVRSQEPVSLVRLQPGVPRDLETICLKCLEKDARRRYASAQELADDLRWFLDNEPIHARPTGAADRLSCTELLE